MEVEKLYGREKEHGPKISQLLDLFAESTLHVCNGIKSVFEERLKEIENKMFALSNSTHKHTIIFLMSSSFHTHPMHVLPLSAHVFSRSFSSYFFLSPYLPLFISLAPAFSWLCHHTQIVFPALAVIPSVSPGGSSIAIDPACSSRYPLV